MESHGNLCPVIYRAYWIGGTEENISILLTTTDGPDAALTLTTGGDKQDVVVEGSFETGTECDISHEETV